jgi:hypothetical protein
MRAFDAAELSGEAPRESSERVILRSASVKQSENANGDIRARDREGWGISRLAA